MKCELSNREQLIEDYVTGSLSQEEMDAFDEHCFNCDICFEELRLKEEMAALIKAEGKTIFSDYLAKQKVKRVGFVRSLIDKLPRLNLEWQIPQWVYAPVAVGAVAVVCFFIAKNTILPDRTGMIPQENYVVEQKETLEINEQEQLAESQQPVQKEETKHSTEKAQDKPKNVSGGAGGVDVRQLYAENFKTSPFMEEMVNSYSVRSYAITVLSPKIDENVKGNILFQWEEIEQAPIYLKILNNQAVELYSFKPENNQFLFTEKLKPGLYYWKLESEDDVLFVGKFFME